MSVAHHHICACVNTEIKRIARRPVRLLDIGCGDGALMRFLESRLAVLNPGVTFEFYGFDVTDAGVQAPDYATRSQPGNVRLVRSTDPWPYADGFFDVAVSNQVVEHVHDHEFFATQLARVLRDGGVSIHLFPLSECFYEWHVNLPFAHWITDHDALRRYLHWLSALGLGKYKTMKFLTLEEWCEQHADYLLHETSYRSASEIKALAKRHRLRCSFRYTAGFYTAKLRQVLGLAQHSTCSPSSIMAPFARISCVTAVMEKRNAYPGAHPT